MKAYFRSEACIRIESCCVLRNNEPLSQDVDLAIELEPCVFFCNASITNLKTNIVPGWCEYFAIKILYLFGKHDMVEYYKYLNSRLRATVTRVLSTGK